MGAGSSAARYKSELLEESKRIAERSASAAVEEDNLAALRDEVQNLRTQLAAARAAADGAEAEFARRAELWLEEDKEMRLGHLLITAARRLSRFARPRLDGVARCCQVASISAEGRRPYDATSALLLVRALAERLACSGEREGQAPRVKAQGGGVGGGETQPR